MANYTVPAGEVGVHAKTLTPATVDTVTFTGADLPNVEILTDGAADIYVRCGGGVPTVAGTACYRVPAYPGSTILAVETSGDTVVKLISAGAPVYSVCKA